MKPSHWEEVEKLYNAALEREPAMRSAFLAEAAAGNDSLRAEVESLLAHREERGEFLEAPAMEVIAQEVATDSAPSKAEKLDSKFHPIESDTEKSRRRAPWWMYAVGAAFLICAVVRYYAIIVAPENAGILVQDISNGGVLTTGVVIKSIVPNSPAARAGLKPGDIIMSAASDGLIPSDLRLASAYWESGRTYHMEIKRNQESKTMALTLLRNPLSSWLTGPGKVNFALSLVSMLFLILASTVAFSRPNDPAARWGGLWLANLAITAIYGLFTPIGWFSAVMRFPRIIGWLAMLVLYSTGFNQWIGITFLAVFPRKLFRQRWIWALIWLPSLIVMPVPMVMYPNPMHSFVRWWPDWYDHLWRIIVMVATGALALVAILNYLHLRSPDERRRVRIVVVGLAISAAAALLFLARSILLPWNLIRGMILGMPANLWFAIACLYAVFPISMSYAILKHRLFDIHVMIRLAVKYAVARGALISLVPVVSVVFAVDLLLHGNQPLVQILRQRGLLYVLLAAGGFLLHIRRRVWLESLDRRFFREQYDAQSVLRTVVDDVRAGRSFEKVAPQVVSQIGAALHPEFAALMVRQPGDTRFLSLTAEGKMPPPIPAGSKLMALIRVLGKPAEIPPRRTGWPWNQLPPQEIEFLRRSRIEWLFPISLAENQAEALLVMGPKLSEEPYAREDQELLKMIASNLYLLLKQSLIGTPARVGFEECPECGACYDYGSGSCTKEGTKLKHIAFPRILDHRYRFEQRLGEGGMGMVYRAVDTELERQVAVKLIRPELTVSTDAALRFKQEAKAAAGFTHPNVVTIHDYGVAENQRAYIVMELLRGLTLRQTLSKNGHFSVQHTSEILHYVGTAVDAAHRRRLIHRDLKPENIFLADIEGVETAKILDFGVVKPVTAMDSTKMSIGQTGPGMLVGTLKYMSPEQLRGEEPAESWDIWSVSVVAYEMLAGEHPFPGSTAIDIRDAILAGHMTPLRKYLPKTPESWQNFFDRALSPRVELRPNSARQFFSDFKQSIQ